MYNSPRYPEANLINLITRTTISPLMGHITRLDPPTRDFSKTLSYLLVFYILFPPMSTVYGRRASVYDAGQRGI